MSLTVCIILVPGRNGGAQAPPGRKCHAIPECGRYRRIQQAFAGRPTTRDKRPAQKENARRGRSRVFEGTTGGEEGRRGSRRGGRGGAPRPSAILFLVAGRSF